MLRFTRAWKRRPGLTPREFRRRFARFYRALLALPAARALKKHAAATAVVLPGFPRTYDGVLDLWGADDDALCGLFDDPQLHAMEGKLFSPGSELRLRMQQRPTIIEGQSALRFTALLARNPALSQQQFSEHHHARHAPLFAAVPAVRRHLRYYGMAHRCDETCSYDGLVDFGFDHARAMMAMLGDAEYQVKIGPDERYMLDLPHCAVMLLRPLR